jgi:hypothetical protein
MHGPGGPTATTGFAATLKHLSLPAAEAGLQIYTHRDFPDHVAAEVQPLFQSSRSGPSPAGRVILQAAAGARDRGAAISEFALLPGLVSLILLADAQLELPLHLHRTAPASVIEEPDTARADSTPALGADRARQLLEWSLPGTGGAVTPGRTSVGGVKWRSSKCRPRCRCRSSVLSARQCR